MFRAIYNFSSKEEDVLPIRKGEIFIFIHEHDSNWWKMQAEDGLVGLVPASYLEPDENEMDSPDTKRAVLRSIERAMEMIHAQAASNGGVYTNEQRTNLKKLLEHRNASIRQKHGASQRRTAPKPPQKSETQLPPQQANTAVSATKLEAERPSQKVDAQSTPNKTESLSEPPKAESQIPPQPKRQAPGRPDGDNRSIKGECSKSFLRTSEENVSVLESSGSQSLLYCKESTEAIKNCDVVVPSWFVSSLLEDLREKSGISYQASLTVTETVLKHIKTEIPCLADPMNKIIEEVLKEKENDLHSDESLLMTHDGQNLQSIFEALTQHKDDSQQRSWALHMDEPTILEQLNQLLSLLVDANQKVSKTVIEQNDFEYLHSLVVYFQMEHRSVIRQQLLQVFGCICGIDKDVISQLLCSILPGELARAIQVSQDDMQLQLYSSLVLTMIFSTAEPMPFRHYEQLNIDFVNFLVHSVENAPEGEQGDQIIDSFVGLLLAFNQHFIDPENDIVMDVLAACRTAKNFSEKVMLLFNRGEDPAVLFPSYPRHCSNSVVKFLSDIFSSRRTSGLFFTSDMMVMLEIILRQITDLNPGNNTRTEYLSLLHLIITNTDYYEHKHLCSELNMLLKRISNEDDAESQKDKYIVKEIFAQFPDLFRS